jgi:hypothetical protein
MSAPLNQPPVDKDTAAPDPAWAAAGIYVQPVSTELYTDLHGIGAAPAAPYGWTRDNLGEDNYAPGRAAGADVDRHINTDVVHGPFYGESGPRAYPD